jgi:hypothetical protein
MFAGKRSQWLLASHSRLLQSVVAIRWDEFYMPFRHNGL